MRKNYFILVVAHAVHGRIKRIRIPHYAIHIVISLAMFGAIAAVGLVSSYTRMLLKVSELNDLRAAKEALQKRYDELKLRAEERDTQLASLGNLANEVSIAFGIKRQADESPDPSWGTPYSAHYEQSFQQFDFLQQVKLSTGGSEFLSNWLENTTPSIWPVQGRLSSAFGKRLDPFLGTGAFHPGVDMSARNGTPVVAAADGVVANSGWSGRYGKRVVIQHGRNSLSTNYAHLSDYYVRPGQIVRRGEVIGRVGSTGKTTSAHLHYEVRYRGTPVNPYKYLRKRAPQKTALRLAD